MKKYKLLLIAFVCTFAIGGFNLVSAYSQSRSISGLKADFLGSPHYSPDVIGRDGTAKSGISKNNDGAQGANITVKNNRTIGVAVSDESGSIVTEKWYTITGTTNGDKTFGSTSYLNSGTGVTGVKFAFAAKLLAPWTQAEIQSGTWIIGF